MPFRSCLFAAAIVAFATLFLAMSGAGAVQTAAALPAEISDADFWRMIVEFSEPGGTYPYENFVSNEPTIQQVIPALKATTKTGGVFIGVGPEQNFTYMSALQSKLGFIIDIRRQNMLELLMYKALFELSPDRAEFVSRLFSRVRPASLDSKSTPAALFAAYEKAETNADQYTRTLQAIKASLAQRGFRLSSDDLIKIDYVYQVFYRGGPQINYEFSSSSPATRTPTYTQLMTASDPTGRNWSFLASEENYQYIRELQRKNLIVPLVGDFAGPGAIRNVGRYLRERNATVSAFYFSNVEYYLNAGQRQQFYGSVATLPVDSSSMAIRFIAGITAQPIMSWYKTGNISAISPLTDVTGAVLSGGAPTYEDLLRITKDPMVLAGLSSAPDLGLGPLVYVPKGGPPPTGYVLIGTTRQTIQLVNGSSTAVDLEVYSRK